MADDFTQANRRLRISTPLGPDALLITSLTGTEGISTLFQFQAELLGRDERSTSTPSSARASPWRSPPGAATGT